MAQARSLAIATDGCWPGAGGTVDLPLSGMIKMIKIRGTVSFQ